MYIKVPGFIRKLFPDLIWSFSDSEKKAVYLTFDDGPTPDITDWILNTLSNYDAKATFFCLGKNVELHPELYNKLIAHGHAVGNHTYSHQKGFSMSTELYVQDVDLADGFIHSPLFRPPYGQITPRQAKRISERYKLIMWDVLSRDYSSVLSETKCLKGVIKDVKPGSIIVFHDSQKSFKNMSYTLPRLLDYIYSNDMYCTKIEI